MSSTTGHEIDPGGVQHPAHYNLHPSGVECIDIIKHHNLSVGTAMKYLWRQGLKDGEPSLKDLRKAIEYIQFEIERLQEEERKAHPPYNMEMSKDQYTLLLQWEGEVCKCVDPIPTLSGYLFYVCANCLGQVPDEKLVHKQ